MRARLTGPGLLLLIALGFFWKLILTSQYTWLDHPDMVNQVLPWYQFQAREWHAGRVPLWDPNHWAGQSLIGQAQPGAAYPPNWLFFRIAYPRRAAMHWYYVAIHYLAALFAWMLARDLGRSQAASILAGCIFAFGGYVGSTNWPQMLNGAVWAPLILLYFRRPGFGGAALSGAALGMAFLSGHHQAPVFLGLMLAALWIWRIFRERNSRVIAMAAVSAAIVLLVGALQILPAHEYGKDALRWVGSENPVTWNQKVPYSVHGQFSMTPLSLIGLVIPSVGASPNPFIGIAAVLLGLIALYLAWDEEETRLFAGVGALGLVLALGAYSPFHGLLYSTLPQFDKARSPSTAILLFHLAAAMLAARGLDACAAGGLRRLFVRRLTRGLAMTAAVTLAGLLAAITVRPQKESEYDNLALAALTALALAAVLKLWRHGGITSRAGSVLLLLLSLFELANVTTRQFRHRELGLLVSKLGEHDDIAQFLQSQPGRFRVEVDKTHIPYNFGDWYGIEEMEGYTASVLSKVHQVHKNEKVRSLLGVKYFIGPAAIRSDQRKTFTGRSGLSVFENPGVSPRVWAETCQEQSPVTIAVYESNRVSIDADLRCKSLVVLADANSPGWEAAVDGVSAPIVAAHGFLRGVMTDQGKHRIEYRYRPRPVWWGGLLTAVGLIATQALKKR